MNYWRMTFRWGEAGPEVWKECLERRIAAIGYYTERGTPVVGDCSKLTKEEYLKICRAKMPHPGSARKSLQMLAYEMKQGDEIFAKQGGFIVGKGTIKGNKTRAYQYDPNILKGAIVDGIKISWEHFVEVDWEKDFQKFPFRLRYERSTVLKLKREDVAKILKMGKKERQKIEEIEAVEGERYKSEASFRSRKRALIAAKKVNSDYRCEVCGMSFEEKYGDIGREFIIAHHKNPIGARRSASKTTLDDIALVCANCHEMIHKKESPFSIIEIRREIKV